MNKLNLFAAAVLMSMTCGNAFAQETAVKAGDVISGKVMDARGFPISNGILSEQDETGKIFAQAMTDANGDFSFRLVGEGHTLNISYVGYSGLKSVIVTKDMTMVLTPTGVSEPTAQLVVLIDFKNNIIGAASPSIYNGDFMRTVTSLDELEKFIKAVQEETELKQCKMLVSNHASYDKVRETVDFIRSKGVRNFYYEGFSEIIGSDVIPENSSADSETSACIIVVDSIISVNFPDMQGYYGLEKPEDLENLIKDKPVLNAFIIEKGNAPEDHLTKVIAILKEKGIEYNISPKSDGSLAPHIFRGITLGNLPPMLGEATQDQDFPLIVVNGLTPSIPTSKLKDFDFEKDLYNQKKLAALLGIQPDEIKSFSFSKEYLDIKGWGNRAKNGVIKITTKQSE